MNQELKCPTCKKEYHGPCEPGIPVVSWVKRYWLMLVLLVALVALWRTEVIFVSLRAVIVGPMLCCLAVATALLIRNIFYRRTIDADADSGRFVREWEELPPERRVTLTIVMTAVILLSCSIIVAAVAN